MIRTRPILSATLFARALFSLTLLSAVGACARQDKRTTEQPKEVQEAREAFAKLGATYSGPAEPHNPGSRPLFVYDRWEPRAKPTVHVFRMPPGTEDRDLKVLPNPPFAFELDLSGTRVTDEGLKELAPLRNLTRLHLRGKVTDATLRALREAGLLHALPQASNNLAPRPTKPEEVTWLDLRDTQVTDAGMKELAPLRKLTTLHLYGTQVTDAGLKELAPLQNLTTLLLPGTVTDAGLKELAALKSLTMLHFPPNTVTGETLRALREAGLLHTFIDASGAPGKRPTKLEEITVLSLTNARVDDEGLKELVPLKNLTTLHLSATQVTAAGLKELAPLKNLTTLSLSGPATDAGLKELAPLQSLTTLTLFGTKVTDAGMKELATLKNLTVLNLSYTKVTDVGLGELAALKNLTTLYLRDTKVSDKGVEALQQALPKCKISR